jgi:hypothetical protein
MKRYSVDVVTSDNGSILGWSIFDEFIGDYIGGTIEDFETALDDCDIMNEAEEIESGREYA